MRKFHSMITAPIWINYLYRQPNLKLFVLQYWHRHLFELEVPQFYRILKEEMHFIVAPDLVTSINYLYQEMRSVRYCAICSLCSSLRRVQWAASQYSHALNWKHIKGNLLIDTRTIVFTTSSIMRLPFQAATESAESPFSFRVFTIAPFWMSNFAILSNPKTKKE